MSRIVWILAIVTCSLSGCGGADAPIGTTTGTAVVEMLDREWRVRGTCERSGEDLTFIGPGDPMLNIGINTMTNSNPVGNFSSAREGFGVIIGSTNAPQPSVTGDSGLFIVSGNFTVFDEDRVDGRVTVDCRG